MPSSIHPTASSPIRERNPSADRSEQSGDPRAFHPGFGAKFTHTTSRRPPFELVSFLTVSGSKRIVAERHSPPSFRCGDWELIPLQDHSKFMMYGNDVMDLTILDLHSMWGTGD